MRKILRSIIIIACIVIAILMIMFKMCYEIECANKLSASSVDLMQWITSEYGKEFFANMCYDVGIGLIGAIVFMLGVEIILNHEKNVETQLKELEEQRVQISYSIRFKTMETIEHLKVNGKLNKGLLSNQFFAGCNFKSLNLEGADFNHTVFHSACFDDCNLSSANLSNCNLTDASFKNANLCFTVFENSTLDINQLKQAGCLWNAIMPDGSIYDGRFNLAGDIEIAHDKGFDLNNEEHKKLFFNIRN